ncbi:P-type conjugative transfer protein TrbJ [Rhodanobacter sp. DHB23]|uniref:P-type conjugative transfer protein TrbJ n=1 Tax=Rhodanobacter sp. DHB23 TaxID=2775923 RepID=UPI001785652B|nr:P-type conjugative transfer protein TrbJ [Rhodanobacter sp. DHB23]MBD8872877.1 P-type conjugative transfer protein TrbJ [Rhodanobacter sp. DHB23]
MKKLVLSSALVAALALSAIPALAGIPVIDGSNLAQNIVTALETVAQYEQQIQQYTTQLQQYENMLTNTAALPQQTWSQVQGTINGLTQAMQGLQNMTNGAGSIQAYLDKFGNTNTYASQPCFNGSTCTQTQLAAIQSNNATGNAGVKAATDSELEALQQQQASLSTDAANVQQLQSSAAGASGQKAALDAANQLAAAQTNQLVQIRALLVAQQTAQAAAQEQQNAINAQQTAGDTAVFTRTPVSTVQPEQFDIAN